MIIIYIDILLLIILLALIVFTCGYCLYRVHRLRRNGEISILLKPTKVMFSQKLEGESTEQLRTVVAYQNPFTGDYCIHKSRLPAKGYVNHLQPDSPDSGVSDEYEPLNLDPIGDQPTIPSGMPANKQNILTCTKQAENPVKVRISPDYEDNSVNKSWNWQYKEYQI